MAGSKPKGPASSFQGERAKFLQAFYPTYADASKKGKTRGIWATFFVEYWAKFPWRLPLKQDPDPDDPTDYSRKPETLEEITAHTTVIAATENVSRAS
jgi:hypothetical protein